MKKSKSRITELTTRIKKANRPPTESVQKNMYIILKSLIEIKDYHDVLSSHDWQIIMEELVCFAKNQKPLFDLMGEVMDAGTWFSNAEKTHSEIQDYLNGIYTESKNESN